METLKGFHADTPLIVEETFPLKCSPEELVKFIEEHRAQSAGWVSFYWGKPAKDYGDKTFAEAITRDWLLRFQAQSEKLRK